VASCRNIADLLTRNKWKTYDGKCKLARKIREIAREIPWETVNEVIAQAPLRATFRRQATESKEDFISTLRALLQDPKSFR
jgi:hypothetical protein